MEHRLIVFPFLCRKTFNLPLRTTLTGLRSWTFLNNYLQANSQIILCETLLFVSKEFLKCVKRCERKDFVINSVGLSI